MFRQLNCCGVQEYTALPPKAQDTILECYFQLKNTQGAFILFSDTVSTKKMKALADYIKENDLGTFALSDERLNTNSSHKISVLLWGYDKETLEKWFKKEIGEQPKLKLGDIVKLRRGLRVGYPFTGGAIYKREAPNDNGYLEIERLDGNGSSTLFYEKDVYALEIVGRAKK